MGLINPEEIKSAFFASSGPYVGLKRVVVSYKDEQQHVR